MLLADQVAAVQRTLPATVVGNLLLAALVVWALQGHVPVAALAAWVGLLALHCAANVWVIAATRRRPVTPRNAHRRARAGMRSALVLGLVWAGGILMLWPVADAALPQKFLLIFLVAGVSSGALHSLSALLPAFTAFFVPTVSAVAVAALREGGPVFLAVAGIAAIYGLVTWRYASSLNGTLLDAMRGRHELAALAARLEQEVQRVEQAQRARSRLLAAASHDLRQPVHALSLALGLATTGPMPPTQAQRLSLAQRTVEGLSAQLDALLDLGRLDAGELRAQPRAVALRPLVESIVDAMRPQADARGLHLRLRAADATAFTDPLLAERMVRNLLANAIRYTDRGGIVVAVRDRPGRGPCVEVVDTGIGIAPEKHMGIFDEFVQADRESGRGGFGLGLAIVQGCAKLLGHGLALRSAPGRGSRFTIDMQPPPRASLQAGQVDAAPPATAPAGRFPERHALAGALIVIVEDDAAVRGATAELVARWGAEVVAAADVSDALAGLVTRRVRPALVIAGGRLAMGAGGTEAVQRVREEYNDDELPGLVISADIAALDAARAAGLVALRKPVTPAALESAAREAVAIRPAQTLRPAT
ncbi:MAG: hypothetical protein J0M00_11695 [Burkholderiales bacterium]|nr:hypothetical protein [Burkholderiales bacterium]